MLGKLQDVQRVQMILLKTARRIAVFPFLIRFCCVLCGVIGNAGDFGNYLRACAHNILLIKHIIKSKRFSGGQGATFLKKEKAFGN